jgi:hypothetical protein
LNAELGPFAGQSYRVNLEKALLFVEERRERSNLSSLF